MAVHTKWKHRCTNVKTDVERSDHAFLGQTFHRRKLTKKAIQTDRRSPSTTEGEKQPSGGYDSAIACHLAANKTCSRRYEVGDFSVLTRARTKNHLHVLEAVYISVLNPVLCKQKSFVTSLTLFQRTQRTHPP